MNLQEAFDKIVTHLLTQRTRSLSSDGWCRYKSDDGKKCAIGCLISDEDYKPEMEMNGIINLHFKNMLPSNLQELAAKDLFALQVLQNIHDEAPIELWENELRAFAHDYELEFKGV